MANCRFARPRCWWRTSARIVAGLLGLALLMAGSHQARAHFPWLVESQSDAQPFQLQCFFAESPVADDPELLTALQGAQTLRVPPHGEPVSVELQRQGAALTATIPPEASEQLFLLTKEFGVLKRGETAFLLNISAKTGPSLRSFHWQQTDTKSLLALDLVPRQVDGMLELKTTFDGKPVPNAEVLLFHATGSGDTLKTDGEGLARIPLTRQGIVGVRLKHVVAVPGESNGQPYSEVRHYLTVTFPAATYQPIATTMPYPPLPTPVTSFGAAAADDALYIFGGNTGSAHHYSRDDQEGTLWRLKTAAGSVWEPLPESVQAQGLAMVADGGKLYRLGGFAARNQPGADQDLWSQAEVTIYDLRSNRWTPGPSLPEPRSSFDAAVLDHTIYVVGGWALQGATESRWHRTAWALDLTREPLEWRALPEPPFERRALAVAAFAGKLYAIGGMQKAGAPTNDVAIFDPQTQAWSEGPAVAGSGMSGFGAAASVINGSLYVSTFDGTLQRLSERGNPLGIAGQS